MWQLGNLSWEQDDIAQTFRLKYLGESECTAEPAAPLSLLVGAKWHRDARADLACSHGAFPAEFVFCPYCGGDLSETNDASSVPWIPPYGGNTGLKVWPQEVRPVSMAEHKGQPFALPSMNGRYVFCSLFLGAKKRLLLAFERDTGRVRVSQSVFASGWRDIEGKAGDDGLPEWSWSLAADRAETGFAVPGRNGPAWITIDWPTNNLRVNRGEGRSIGGVTRLGKFLLAPVLRGDCFYMLCRKEGEADWSECKAASDSATVVPQLSQEKDQQACFGIPVIDETRMVAYWPCRGGYIRVPEADTAGEHVWEFRSWETDEFPATALIELGPPYRKIGSRSGLWQLCEDYDPSRREGRINKIIKFDGDERADSEAVEYGQFVSTGRASFSWLYDFWTDVHQFDATAGEQMELRYPLLQFGEKGMVLIAKVRPWQGREDMALFSEVLFNRRERSLVFVRFVIEGAGTPEKALYVEGVDGTQGVAGSLFRVPLSHLAEISTFIHNGHLHIYFPEDNSCYGWPLEVLDV